MFWRIVAVVGRCEGPVGAGAEKQKFVSDQHMSRNEDSDRGCPCNYEQINRLRLTVLIMGCEGGLVRHCCKHCYSRGLPSRTKLG